MKKLIRRTRCFLMATVGSTAIFMIVALLRPHHWQLPALVAAGVALLTVYLFVKTKKAAEAARLIIENQIMHIRPAVFGGDPPSTHGQEESVEVFVSCFGILLGSQVIKFNQEGVRLKAVELDRQFISLWYGSDCSIKTTRLLHAEMSEDALTQIAERFLYETGVTVNISPERAG